MKNNKCQLEYCDKCGFIKQQCECEEVYVNNKVQFKVYETETNKDVTDKCEWFIGKNGKLLCMIDCCLIYASSDFYYYKLDVI